MTRGEGAQGMLKGGARGMAKQREHGERRSRGVFTSLAGSWLILGLTVVSPGPSVAETLNPDQVIRAIVRANADRDLAGMARFMARDADAINYSIAGSKFVGWTPVARALTEEFQTVARLEMPIHELRVWVRENFAYFAMELDYVRYIRTDGREERTLVPLRETGVLERRDGQWILVAWHESVRAAAGMPQASARPLPVSLSSTAPDLSGKWKVEETDRAYDATLDEGGNGTYTWQGGQLKTTRL